MTLYLPCLLHVVVSRPSQEELRLALAAPVLLLSQGMCCSFTAAKLLQVSCMTCTSWTSAHSHGCRWF